MQFFGGTDCILKHPLHHFRGDTPMENCSTYSRTYTAIGELPFQPPGPGDSSTHYLACDKT